LKIKYIKQPIRTRLTASFIAFAVVLMGILWLMQAVFLSQYYESSMRTKCESALKTISTVYSTSENLTYDDFCTTLSNIGVQNDIYFYVEAVDKSFFISSTGDLGQGRLFRGAEKLIQEVKRELVFSSEDMVSVSSGFDSVSKEETIVFATFTESKSLVPVYIYAVTSLTPIGPAVKIIRSQLLIATIVSLVLAIVIAAIISRRLAKPISKMSKQAKELASGNYDVVFDGGEGYEEVSELANTLTEAAKDLKKSDLLQKDLLANVSHDLRTPLTMIKSYAEMVRDISGENPEKREEHLNVIIEETDRLSALVDDVLALSKMQAGVTEMEFKDFDLKKAAESVFSTYKVMENEGFKMEMAVSSSAYMVNGDEHRIKQVVSNLLSNAIKYSGETKDVSLVLAPGEEKNTVRLSVLDKGIGIADEDQEKIWHRYEKASSKNGRPQGGSSGLGLNIAAEILDIHKAKYGVVSKLKEGSTFWFELPLA